MRATFENGHGEYEAQPLNGYCVRSTDGSYEDENLIDLYDTSDSVYQCVLACNAEPTCVAFDYDSTTGFCYGYKTDADPLASYVGSGTDSDWTCYTHISIPITCDSIYQDTVDAVASISLFQYNLYLSYSAL